MLRFIPVALVVLLGSTASADWQPVDRVAAVVGSEVILGSDVNRGLLRAGLRPEAGQPSTATRRSILNQLIDRRLVLAEARSAKLRVSEADVDAAVAEVVRSNQFTAAQFKAKLAASGYDERSYRLDIREQLLFLRAVNHFVRPRVRAVEEDERKSAMKAAGARWVTELRRKVVIDVRL